MGNHGNCAGISQLRFLFTHMLPELAQLEACGFFKAIVTSQADYIGVYRLPEVACGQGYIAHGGNLCCRNLCFSALTTGHQHKPRLQVCQQLLVRFFQAAGIGIGAIAGAVTQVMLSRVAIDAANAAYPWTVGSLNARSGNSMLVLAIGLAAGYAILMLISRGLNTLQFSDAVAIALGTRLKATRILGLALSVLLTGLAVSVCGPVGLIALLAPELARTICRPGKVPLTASALAGATFMVAADLLGRTLFSPLEIPVGIITAIVGSPYLLWILLKPSRRSLT